MNFKKQKIHVGSQNNKSRKQPLNKDKTKILITNGSLMKVERIAQGWAENSTPVFTGGIYLYFLAWQIRLKWKILANNGKFNFFRRKILANMIFSCKMQQIIFWK